MGCVGWSPREKEGWASVHPQGGGRVCRDDGGQCPEWEGRDGCILFLCWTTVQRMKPGVQNPFLLFLLYSPAQGLSRQA